MISVLKSKLDGIVTKTKTEIRDVPYRVRWKNQKHILILFIFLAQLKVCRFPLTFCFWTGFTILGCIYYYGLILLLRAEFILNWSKHFRLNCSRYYALCFLFWNKYLILSWFCHSGLIFILDRTPNIGLKAHFVILGSFGHSGMSSSFDDWINHSAVDFSPWLNLSFLSEFVNRGWFVILG